MAKSAARPRCPFAIRGVDSAEMAACPGFDPQEVLVGAERIVGSGMSCQHLRPQRDPGRPGAFVSACHHPDAPVVERVLHGHPAPITYSTNGALRRVLET